MASSEAILEAVRVFKGNNLFYDAIIDFFWR